MFVQVILPESKLLCYRIGFQWEVISWWFLKVAMLGASHLYMWHEAASSLWSYILMRISHTAWEDHTVSPRQLTQHSHTDIVSHDQLSHPILDNKLDKPAAPCRTSKRLNEVYAQPADIFTWQQYYRGKISPLLGRRHTRVLREFSSDFILQECYKWKVKHLVHESSVNYMHAPLPLYPKIMIITLSYMNWD